mgnify:FL=1
MSDFFSILTSLNTEQIRRQIEECRVCDVERVLLKGFVDDDELPILFSPAAGLMLEEMARRSAALTLRRFGRVIQLYAPLYLSNECANRCRYCGFAGDLDIPRMTLTPKRAISEGDILHRQGFRHILLVSGESPRHVSMDYLLEVVRGLSGKFASISIELYPMEKEEYQRLAEAGVDGIALYQETYNQVRYLEVHPPGPKRDFRRRLAAIEKGGEASFRSLGVGALLGLTNWRLDAFILALHSRYLMRRFWQSRIAASFPRIREAAGHYTPDYPISDADFVQMICAMRLILPDAELVMSTRESAALRDNLIGLGITRMSAGSRTNPGGYGASPESGGQFEVEDSRTPAEVARAIASKGFEPVFKDFDRAFIR